MKPKEKSADEIARKEAILAQYGAISDGEETYPSLHIANSYISMIR